MSLLAGDVTAEPLAEEGGSLPVRRPALDQQRIADWHTDPAPWRSRVAAAAEFLGTVALCQP
jgi:O-succinylbenzoate synthase